MVFVLVVMLECVCLCLRAKNGQHMFFFGFSARFFFHKNYRKAERVKKGRKKNDWIKKRFYFILLFFFRSKRCFFFSVNRTDNVFCLNRILWHFFLRKRRVSHGFSFKTSSAISDDSSPSGVQIFIIASETLSARVNG